MKNALTRPLALVALLLPVLAHAHPGHDGDHDFEWDFDHLVNHPWATVTCVVCVVGIGLVCWRLLKSDTARQTQKIERD
jgi:hydrogenase/urease accessory protein HupE